MTMQATRAEATDSVAAALARYAQFYREIAPERLSALHQLCAPQVRFRDPFNDVYGVEKLEKLFRKAFEDVEDLRFEVTDTAISGSVGYLRWNMSYRPKQSWAGRDRWHIEGMTEVHFDAGGRVTQHLDYWDSGEIYQRVPLLGGVVRALRRRLALD